MDKQQIEKIEEHLKEKKCSECGTFNKLDEIKDDTYCKNCGKWLN